MSEQNIDYKRAYERERKARDELEGLLEAQTRRLYEANIELEDKVAMLEKQKNVILKTEKMATLGTLAAGVAHEINNPLAYVSSNIESLFDFNDTLVGLLHLARELSQSEEIDPDLKAKFVELQKGMSFELMAEDIVDIGVDVQEGVRRIAGIVSNLLSFSRPKENKSSNVNLAEVSRSILKLAASQLRNVVVKTEIEEVPETCCNADAIGQVILNLLLNAKDACESELTRQSCVGLSINAIQEHILISVSDNGVGMDETTLTKIFEPFYTTKDVGKGTGMGMAIVYGFIEEHNGTIHVESKLGQGTSITVSLPIIN
ncbi:ATP-binding protein (plasmid) [Pseudoalteromonas xiamenensis]|uniref:sensor histidine kinase n=2 Tax=Pseudoalteromonas xiamenensis TaxID=882626 RepID=UPI0027E40E80|nr:ATP-binding protein [Pseudoalteromonas xiamenensis]WMN61781.1 ATP-binding protein [Pseudoalteromonas xiamenensis]